MEARLVPLNALLGLVTPGDINPAVLGDAGFSIAGLEIPASGSSGKVVIDALLFHRKTNHLVLCESKSGANIEESQAKAYRALTPNAAVQAACVTLAEPIAPTSETVYLCTEANAERIRLGLKTAGVAFPVLSVGERRIELLDAEYASHPLRRALADGIELAGPPARILPFDVDSPVEVASPHVRAALVTLVARRVTQISLTGLTEQSAPHYALYGQRAQFRLKSLVALALRIIVETAPDRFAYDPPTGSRQEGLVRFLRTPEDFDPRGRTQAYQALGRMASSGTSRRPRTDPNQLDLLQELEFGDDEDETVGSDEEGWS